MIHLRRYLAALAIVLSLYGGYALAVVPLLQPPEIVKPPLEPTTPLATPSSATQLNLATLFPPGSWELNEPKIVETEHVTLLVQDYLPTPDGKLKLNPCTLIFYAALATGPQPAGAKPARRPIVMQAPQGAELQFDRALNIAKAEFGQVVGGHLTGEITIFSPPTAPGADDAIRLTTREVRIAPDRVYTNDNVEFQFGKSAGRGRDLTIALLPKDPEAPAGKQGIGGVRSLTLARVDRLHIETEGGLIPMPGEKAKSAAPAPLHITCQGAFVFDVTERMAMFDEAVLVERITPGAAPDVLRCDRLLLYQGQQESSLQRIVAIGNPATLAAPASATHASAARIEYSLEQRRLTLVPSPTVPQVSLRQAAGEFVARELEYEQAAAGKLGRLWAAGPGQLKLVQTRGPHEQTIVARWEKELRVRPQDASHVISLIEQASITADPLGRFSAGELHFWLQEVAIPAAPGVPPQSTLVAQRLLATDEVRFDSPQLHAETPRLEAWFQNRPANPRSPLAATQPAGRPPANLPASGQPLQKFDVRGDLIQMQLVLTGLDAELEDLTIKDRVQIDETRTPEPNQAPFRIAGDLLTLRGGTTPQAQIDVVGHPAEVGGRGLSLAGGAIHVRRGENRLWIDGPGEAKLPIPAPAPKTGVPPAPPRAATIVWQDGLTFDGLTARLAGEVQARTATQVADCQTLDATLIRRIDFAALSKEPADLAKLTLDGGVFVQNRGVDELGQQVSLELMQVKNLTFDQVAGTLHADGPGRVSTTRPGGAALPGAAAAPPVAVPTPAELPGAASGPPPQLTYVRITFEGEIDGNLANRRIVFRRDVKTTYAPVKDWQDQVIFKQLSDLGEKGVLLTSQELHVVEMLLPGQPRWIETSATGNVLVEGQTFTVQAPLVSYSSDKEVVTLEGSGRADAELWYRDAPGQKSSYASARKWRYFLRSGMFDVEDAKVFDLNQLGNGKFRLPGLQR